MTLFSMLPQLHQAEYDTEDDRQDADYFNEVCEFRKGHAANLTRSSVTDTLFTGDQAINGGFRHGADEPVADT